MIDIMAFANVDDALVVWRHSSKVTGCLGFAIERSLNGVSAPLLNYVGFPGDGPGPRSSFEWPFQRWKWTDHGVSAGDTVAYRVTRMLGAPGHLAPGERSAWTPEFKVGPGTPIGAHFNRGIVASQWVSHLLGPDVVANHPKELLDAIETPVNQLRNALAGELRTAILGILDAAIAGGDDVYATLFELSDPELIARLMTLGQRAHVILANGSHEKPKGQPMKDENAVARAQLTGAVDVHDRMVKSGLAHNKFLVVVDDTGPRVAWTGSTNWTPTGLCTQANNGLLIEDRTVAAAFFAQWQRILAAGDGYPSALRAADGTPGLFSVGPAAKPVTVWFTPLAGLRDLAAASALIDASQHAILFLMFNPGPTDKTLFATIENRAKARAADPTLGGPLFVRGVLNQDPGGSKSPVLMYDERGVVPRDLDVVLPAAIGDPFARWTKELRSAPGAHAMIHSKVIVLDPLGPRPVVMTGSHNLGPRASSSNDDNLVIVEGDASLAQAYMVNILAAYGNYRWRENQRRAHPVVFTDLRPDDGWQDWGLGGPGAIEGRFWFG